MNPLCEICNKERQHIPLQETSFSELYMLCEKCKRDIKVGKYGNDIVELLEEYSVEKQKAELKRELERIDNGDDNPLFSKEQRKEMITFSICYWYGRRNAPFQEVSILKNRITRSLNMHLKKGVSNKIERAYNNYIGISKFYQRALKIHNDIFNDLTQQVVKKYLKILDDADLEKLKEQYDETLKNNIAQKQNKWKASQINSEIKHHEHNLEMINKDTCPYCYATMDWNKLDKLKLIVEHERAINRLENELRDINKKC